MNTDTYRKINAENIKILQKKHTWIEETTFGASEFILELPFFVCSTTFPKTMKMQTYDLLDYYEMLLQWILRHNLILSHKEIKPITPKNNTCVNYTYPIAIKHNISKELIYKAMEEIGLWEAMLNSWIVVAYHPKFDVTRGLNHD